MDFKEVQKLEIENLYMMVATIYENLNTAPLFFAFRTFAKINNTNYKQEAIEILNLEDNRDLYDYRKIVSNFNAIKFDVDDIARLTQGVANSIERIFPNDMEIIQNKKIEFEKFGKVFNDFKDILNIAGSALKVLYKIKDIDDWFKRMDMFHNKIFEIYLSSIDYIKKEIVIDKTGYVELYREFLIKYPLICMYFMEKCDIVMKFKDSIKTVSSIPVDIEPKIVEETTMPVPKIKEPTEAELKLQKEKEILIKQTNDTYFELCADLVDLDSLVPYVAKEYYKKFMSNFEAFNKSFKMPLTNDDSYETAKKANRQLNSLLDFITNEISAKSYVEWGNN